MSRIEVTECVKAEANTFIWKSVQIRSSFDFCSTPSFMCFDSRERIDTEGLVEHAISLHWSSKVLRDERLLGVILSNAFGIGLLTRI